MHFVPNIILASHVQFSLADHLATMHLVEGLVLLVLVLLLLPLLLVLLLLLETGQPS